MPRLHSTEDADRTADGRPEPYRRVSDHSTKHSSKGVRGTHTMLALLKRRALNLRAGCLPSHQHLLRLHKHP
ncbi:hypothetical protein CEXT_32111 [Caerostris extrusa]|uniref:Uncharacterized protein n=1 Tax=Caerostris extrusa TaxID=172846 RepID=A0AAV4QB02_CAEEX|nr:hypothetical protein CEXT_32111 [Caerostris extrusa]